MKKKIIVMASVVGSVCLVAFLIVLFSKKDYNELSFSEKIKQGYIPSVVVVGDSIGGTIEKNQWCTLLAEQLEEKKGISVKMDNISLGGNTVFAGYSQLARYEKSADLIIFCFGQNDADNEDFPIMYENMIRIAKEKYPYASEISILESSQRKYTNKINKIMELSKYYNIPYADMIEAYNDSGLEYDELSNDGIHPNNLGKKLYADTIYNTIVEQILDSRTKAGISSYFIKPTMVAPINSVTEDALHYKYVSKEDMNIENLTVSLEVDEKYMYVGADALFIKGEHGIVGKMEDGEKFYIAYTWDYDPQHHIYKGMNEQPINGKITITFDCQNTLDNFYGLILCD